MKIVALLRVRNEQLLIADALSHLAQWCDEIIVYDDCSNDATVSIVESFSAESVRLIRGSTWRIDRVSEETAHRALLLEHAQRAGYDWCLYIDADERLDFDLRQVLAEQDKSVTALRLTLFDAYLTPESHCPYVSGPISSLPRRFGIEYRHILMLWSWRARVSFVGLDQREPTLGLLQKVSDGDWRVRHYGKAISAEAWEAKCDYYANYFPEPYKTKWADRRGQAVHIRSDFGGSLVEWEELQMGRGVDITPASGWRQIIRRALVQMSSRNGRNK
ncbi:glycosyltransferase family 2 protein [Cryobacterium sp. M91]|uniref:glycosyltransferase family 2 protein n=1 Tax=Cryobacterium sp. M91 TaxID=2048294 RepID=UPI000CE55283|nr:glycosyltransferase family 2 protein [Cryobacterium sp. M91]